MVLSEKVYSPQEYLEEMTGKCFVFDASIDDDIEFIEEQLNREFYHSDKRLWNFPLSQIDKIAGNDIGVVLVECSVWHDDTLSYEKECRWFITKFVHLLRGEF